MAKTKLNLRPLAYLVLQILFILILCLVPQDYVIANSVILLLLGITLLLHSHMLINRNDWSKYTIYNFIIILVTILFIPAYAAFKADTVISVGIVLIVANIVAILINLSSQLDKLQEIVETSKKPEKGPKREYKLVAVEGGSKFHSLDCKMVENKSEDRLKYYYSAHEAQKEGLKPCKLCKAVNYLHQL